MDAKKHVARRAKMVAGDVQSAFFVSPYAEGSNVRIVRDSDLICILWHSHSAGSNTPDEIELTAARRRPGQCFA
jgi:hypothetical protein